MPFQYTFRSDDITTWDVDTRDLLENRDRELELYSTTIDDSFLNLNASNLTSGTVPSARMTGAYTGITSVGTLGSLTVTGDLTVDTNTLRVDSTNNRVGINVLSPTSNLDLVGNQVIRNASGQDGIQLAGRAGGTGSATVKLIPDVLTLNRTITLPNVNGTAITTGNLSSITATGTITSGTWSGSFGAVSGASLTSLNASNLSSGTVASARISGSYTGITGIGTLTVGSIPATLLTGTVASARISGSYTGITGIGTLTSLTINGPSSPSFTLRDWTVNGTWSAVEGYNAHLLMGNTSDRSCYLRTNNTAAVIIGANSSNTLRVNNGNIVVNGTTANDKLNVISGSAWFNAMPAGTGATVVNAFGFLRYVSSRRELKDNIATVDLADGLDRILALRPVEFTMKPEYLADANEYTPFDVKRGFIAQETAEVDHGYGQWGWVDENQMMATTPALNGELPLEDATPIYWNHDAIIADLVASIQNISARLQQLETA
jgi:hypothetical protein